MACCGSGYSSSPCALYPVWGQCQRQQHTPLTPHPSDGSITNTSTAIPQAPKTSPTPSAAPSAYPTPRNSNEVAQASEPPDLPNALNEVTASNYPREYNTFQDTVEKARTGELPPEQEFVIQIENLAEWKEFLGSNEFPEDVRCELRAMPFPAIIVFGPPSLAHEFLNGLFVAKSVPSRLHFLGQSGWTLTNGKKAPDSAFFDLKPPFPDSDIRTEWATVIIEVADSQRTSALRTACDRWITESPPQCLLTVVGVDIRRDVGGDIAHVDVITWRLIHQKEDLREDNWVLKSHDPKTQWRVYAEEKVQRMYTTNGLPVTKPFVLLYEDVFHNVAEEGIAFTITAEEFKEQLLRAEKLRQADIRRELDIKYGKALGNENTSRADKESNAARITKRKRQREEEERDDETRYLAVARLRKERVVTSLP